MAITAIVVTAVGTGDSNIVDCRGAGDYSNIDCFLQYRYTPPDTTVDYMLGMYITSILGLVGAVVLFIRVVSCRKLPLQ